MPDKHSKHVNCPLHSALFWQYLKSSDILLEVKKMMLDTFKNHREHIVMVQMSTLLPKTHKFSFSRV